MFAANNQTIQPFSNVQNPALLNKQPQIFNAQGIQQQTFVQQPLVQQPVLLQQQPALAPGLINAPLGAPLAGRGGKGHHHGRRNKRSQAVIPAGGMVSSTIAQQQTTLLQQQQLQQQQFVQQSGLQLQQNQTVVRPAQVIETIRTDRVLQIQPIVHREIDQAVVHHIEQHITEAPAASVGGVVRNAPIIQETVVRREIDEVQPVIHRELARAQVVRQEEHLAERVVAPTQHTRGVVFENAAAVATPVVAAPVLRTSATIATPVAAPIVAPVNVAPVQHQVIENAPIIQETVRTDRVVEVQPVIHREVDQVTVNHIEQHITQAAAPQMGGVVQMAPIVQETVVRREIDEVQPVIHREVATAVVERVEEHQSQRLVAPTQHTQQVVVEPTVIPGASSVTTTSTTVIPGSAALGAPLASTGAANPAGKTGILQKGKALLHRNKSGSNVQAL